MREDDAIYEVNEYDTLAERVAADVGDVHGCLLLSREGMILGAHPAGDESVAKPAWLRFSALGQAQRGFVGFGDQLWVYVDRGPYAAFAVAGTSVRPGVLMDRLEQALLTAEEARSRREPLRLPEVKAAPSGKPRSSLHPTAPALDEPISVSITHQNDADQPTAAATGHPESADQAEIGPQTGETEDGQTAEDLREAPPYTSEDDGPEVDRVLLATEFSGLLQMDDSGDEASP